MCWCLSLTIFFTGIVRSLNPRDTLTVLSSTESQDCLQDPHQRSPILFGVDFVSGCSLRWDLLTLSFLSRCNVSFISLLSLQSGRSCQLLPGLANYVKCSERIKLSPVCSFLWKLPVRESFWLASCQLQSWGKKDFMSSKYLLSFSFGIHFLDKNITMTLWFFKI